MGLLRDEGIWLLNSGQSSCVALATILLKSCTAPFPFMHTIYPLPGYVVQSPWTANTEEQGLKCLPEDRQTEAAPFAIGFSSIVLGKQALSVLQTSGGHSKPTAYYLVQHRNRSRQHKIHNPRSRRKPLELLSHGIIPWSPVTTTSTPTATCPCEVRWHSLSPSLEELLTTSVVGVDQWPQVTCPPVGIFFSFFLWCASFSIVS